MTSAVRNANELFNKIMFDFGLKSDSALSRALEVSPSVISKIRSGGAPFTDNMLIIVHEATGMSIKELKAILRDGFPTHFSVSPRHGGTAYPSRIYKGSRQTFPAVLPKSKQVKESSFPLVA